MELLAIGVVGQTLGALTLPLVAYAFYRAWQEAASAPNWEGPRGKLEVA